MALDDAFVSDLPVTLLKHDVLDRKRFCENLARIVLLPPSAHSRVVSIEGAWGEGKSSVIEMTIDLIGQTQADLKPFVARINPWQFSSEEEIASALLRELATVVKTESGLEQAAQIAARLNNYADALTVLKTDPSSGVVVSIAQFALRLSAKVGKRLKARATLKKSVSEAIAKSRRPIVVVLDDLDRLLPAELSEVIRFIRAVGDFERTTYLLAYDHPRVVESLKLANVPSPGKFLEKIVQLRTHLPPIRPYQLKRILDARLKDSSAFSGRRLFEGSDARRLELYEFYLAFLIHDVRVLHRTLARIGALPDDITKDVEYWELFSLSSISVICPPLFELVRANPGLFVGSEGPSVENEADKKAFAAAFQDQIDTAINTITQADRRFLRGLVDSLFPAARKSSFGIQKSAGWHERFGRVAAESVLLRVLSAGFSESFSLQTRDDLLHAPERRMEILSRIAKSPEALFSLFDVLKEDVVVGNVRVARPDDLALQLISRWSELRPTDPQTSDELDDRASQALGLIGVLSMQSANVFELLGEVCRNDADGILFARIVSAVLGESGRDGSSAFGQLSPEDVGRLIEDYSQFVRSAALSFETGDDNRMNVLLFTLSRASLLRFSALEAELVVTQKGRRTLIRSLGNSIFSSDAGRVAHWSSEVMERLRRLEELKSEAKQVIAEGHSDKLLLASSRALVEGTGIAVESGAKYRT